jgi:uncharacterized membrane protein YfcA
MLIALFTLLALVGVAFVASWIADMRRAPGSVGKPTWIETAIGFVTNFFDTLGVGSYAPTTSLYKIFKVVPDERIPGTMNIGHTVPTLIQAFTFITIVDVATTTLVPMIIAATLGAWLGAGVVAGLPRRSIQLGMSAALIIAAIAFTASNLQLFPLGGDALGMAGLQLALGLACYVVLGALMTLGIGIYAPTMVMVTLMGMSPVTAFPIMMGSAAFLMPVASIRFLKSARYEPRAALGLTLGGIPAVLIAAFIVKSLPLEVVRWIVVVVVLYAASALLRSAAREKSAATTPEPEREVSRSR